MTAAQATLIAGVITGAAAVLAAVIAGIVVLVTDDPPPPAGADAPIHPTSPAPSSPMQDAPSAPVVAKVINTDGIGVWRFEQPTTESGRIFGPGEGELVEVVCQVRDGEPRSDPAPAEGQPNNWPVWNKLTDGYFIPDLYTNLAKDPGPTPPNGLPVC